VLKIKTLGQFDVVLNGISLLFGTDIKRGLLLAYLLEKRRPQPRLEVARLLWPSSDDSSALVNLRVLLMRMRREGLDHYLDTGRSTIAMADYESIDYDVANLRTLTSHLEMAQMEDLIKVPRLYSGAFLETVPLEGYPQLEEWANAVRTEMAIRVIQGLSVLVVQGISSGHPGMILEYAEKLITLTPYEDDSHELYLLALTKAGRVSDMLSHFQSYKRQLKEKMGTEPGQRLIDIVERLKAPQLHQMATQIVGELTRAEQALNAEDSVDVNHHFPHIEQPLIGREAEIIRLQSLLGEGNRLITVLGIGGTGKTFFVRSQHAQLQTHFGDAIYYVDLRSAAAQGEQASNMLLSIATSLDLKLQPGIPLFDQVVAVLQRTKCCLILDNFETVQSAAPVVLDLLKSSAQLTILVTSRERLNLSIESLIGLGGLSQRPGYTGVADATNQQASLDAESAAVRYFMQCAQRQDIRYTINAEKRLWIEKICRQVDALPLAIELTAMQLPFYSLKELTEQLAVNHAVLTGDLGDLPGDHYSVWAVLDNMWETLSETERRVLAEMSVFAGPFHREAMMSVTPAERSVYTRLINASLLRTEEPAWFSLHSLVKQYAARRLTSDEARRRHARYFLDMFVGGVRVREGLVAQQVLVPPLAVRYHADSTQAWQWAVAHAEWELLDRALLLLSRYFDMTNREQELVQHMQELLNALPLVEERNQLQHRLAGRAAYNLANYTRLSGVPLEFWWERSLSWLEAAGDPWDLAAALLAYADTLFFYSRSWDRIESLLTQAKSLIDQYPDQLDPLRIVSDFTACTYYLYQGEWANLRAVQKALVTRMAHPAHFTTISGNLYYATFLDDWGQVSWLIERIEQDNKDSPALPTWQQWAAHYLCNVMANDGDITGAIAQRLSMLDGYVHIVEQLLPLAYAELAFWQHLVGDTDAAETSAAKALAYVQQPMERLHAAFGQLLVGTFYTLKGDQARAIPLLHTVLDFGRQLHHPTMIFSALYYLVQIHVDTLPTELVQRIFKIGAVSLAMHFVLRPLARQHLAAQGVVIADEERDSLWATDMKTVEALVDEVMKRIA
jgi:predicted ATPase/DNA-binding SARP family transcriptional activator